MARVTAGIDVGGTFTDLLLQDASGRVRLAKVPTTTANQADGVLAAIAAAGSTPAALDLIIHGTTATTNAVLERKLAKVGLITTAGFRDVLELGRRTRPHPYGLKGGFEPLVPREWRREVAERMDARGGVVTPLDEEAVARAVRALLAEGVEALVVHFLHAYANPAHERRAGEIARALWPNAYVTLGHELLSEFREYERGTTAAVNAAVQPVLDRYITRLQDQLAAQGHRRDLLVMNGNGGTVAARLVAKDAAKTVMSGPASGVMAAAATLAQSGLANAITYDMGGTSTDVALIAGGVPEVSAELSIAYGLPIHLPMVDVRTVGAGGGSIAGLDAAGMIRVGPESAGSLPGPIGFGRGGTRPTITDANLVLGRLDPARLLAVAAPVPLQHLRDAFAESLATPLGITVEAAAEAVLRLANVHMTGAIRMVSLSRGHDPRDFCLFAFGGAGPLHAVALAREIGIPMVLVPARPGLTNALGCLVADLRQDAVNTLNRGLDDIAAEEITETLTAQRDRATALVLADAAEVERVEVQHVAEMQFRGQTHLIRVALPRADMARAEIQAAFEAAYFARFQVHLPEIRAVLVNLATTVIGRRRQLDLSALLDPAARDGQALVGERDLYAEGAWHRAAVWQRERLVEGARIAGPAIIQQADATTVLEPRSEAVVDAIGNLRITVQP
ncbi:hydantoinase/oxoprolinase family protein [Falsiroseomonas selenitidurans]|uniref:Hydantoinase/oxoprolinase family protein n=1 Tax=Falsiroseomonas selenitidurans TaxID=2716335 RepID=A0ABX1E7L4_9PROT|nr:hydantoinase/oxoprolinase family protein [Falsiroseomonas selenitidurans]NKC33181.1 hydantoinase/oxoprolinase family protein [Falsiroseomonas selenitidurans]